MASCVSDGVDSRSCLVMKGFRVTSGVIFGSLPQQQDLLSCLNKQSLTLTLTVSVDISIFQLKCSFNVVEWFMLTVYI